MRYNIKHSSGTVLHEYADFKKVIKTISRLRQGQLILIESIHDVQELPTDDELSNAGFVFPPNLTTKGG